MTPYDALRIVRGGLVIRPWRPEQDAEAAYAIYSDPEVVEHLDGVVVESVDAQRGALGQIVDAYRRLGRALGSFAVELEATGEVVGCALLKPLPHTGEEGLWRDFRDGGPPPPVREIEVGWHLARAHWGKGYATKAGRAMLAHGFESEGLDEIHAVLFRANARSARVAQRLGMEHLGPTGRFYGVEVEHYRAKSP